MTKKQMKKLVSKEGRRLFLYASPIGILIGGIAGYFIIPSGFSIINTLIIAVGRAYRVPKAHLLSYLRLGMRSCEEL